MVFTLQVLHTSDQEAGIPALQDAIGLSAVMNALDDQYENSLRLTSGDGFISSPFFSASADLYDSVAGAGQLGAMVLVSLISWFKMSWVGTRQRLATTSLLPGVASSLDFSPLTQTG